MGRHHGTNPSWPACSSQMRQLSLCKPKTSVSRQEGSLIIYEHWGENRSGKTLLHALFGWFAYLAGMQVYCNCPQDPYTEEYVHIVRNPHIDYDPARLFQHNLINCYVITDQAEQVMDERLANKTSVRNMGYFSYQAKKRLIEWHYDTVRIKNIELRVRLNPDFRIHTERVPHDYRQALKAIKVTIWPPEGAGEHDRVMYLVNPERFFPLYNHLVLVPPEE